MNDLEDIAARVADCMTYNFGLTVADRLAHDDAPWLVAEVTRLRGELDAASGEGVAAAKYWRQLQAMTADRDRWVKLWETASNSVIRLRADIESAVQQPNREALAAIIYQSVNVHEMRYDDALRAADDLLAALAVPATGEAEWEPAKWHELQADGEDNYPTGDTIRLTWDDGTVLVGRLSSMGHGSGHHQTCRMHTVFGGDTWVWPHGATLSRRVGEVTP